MTRIVCSKSFLLENLIVVLSVFLPSRWPASVLYPEIFTPILCRIKSADSGLQHIMFKWGRYAHNLYTFLTGVLCVFPVLPFCWTQLLNQKHHSPSWLQLFPTQVFWVFFQVSLRSERLLLLVCSWVFKKSLMSCVLFKGCNVSSV